MSFTFVVFSCFCHCLCHFICQCLCHFICQWHSNFLCQFICQCLCQFICQWRSNFLCQFSCNFLCQFICQRLCHFIVFSVYVTFSSILLFSSCIIVCVPFYGSVSVSLSVPFFLFSVHVIVCSIFSCLVSFIYFCIVFFIILVTVFVFAFDIPIITIFAVMSYCLRFIWFRFLGIRIEERRYRDVARKVANNPDRGDPDPSGGGAGGQGQEPDQIPQVREEHYSQG